MKKHILILFCIFFLGLIIGNAQNVNVDLSVKFNGDFKSDSVYLFFYSTTNHELGQALPAPVKQFVFNNLKNDFQIYPGAYTIVAMSFGNKYLYSRIYIPPVKNFSIEIAFNPSIIGWGGINAIEQINEVTLRGEFNGYQKNGEIALTKQGNVWKLVEKPEVLKVGKEYTFYVNEEETTDLLNSNFRILPAWSVFKNLYSNNELVFDPSLYSLVYKESELKVADTLQQFQFKQLVNEINLLEKEKNEIFRNATSREAVLPLFDTIITKYSIIQDKYPKDISQLFAHTYLDLIITKILLDTPQGNQNDPEFENTLKNYFLGKEFEVKFKKINEMINNLDPNSFLLNGDFVLDLNIMQNLLNEFPELAPKNNLSEKYYDEFVDHFIEKSSNKKLCYSILIQNANMLKSSNEAKAIEILDEIENNHDYADFIDRTQIDRILGQINIKLGKFAPNFSVDLLNGKKISLNDYKGKYVFIDFWGSWCAPCREEIPNLKLMYNSLSRDKLEIIGLAYLSQDTETILRDYIKEQKIEYPNALAPEEVLAKYGISRFPTSFLINPKGKIVRIDVRGADAMKLITEEIEDYYN